MRYVISGTITALALALSGCDGYQEEEEMAPVEEQVPEDAAVMAEAVDILRVEFKPMNESVDGGEGSISLNRAATRLDVTARISGVAPHIMHLQHFHGFKDGSEAKCPGPEADTNGDGLIDLIETQQTAGVTLIPLNEDPVELEIMTDTYPTADEQGNYVYEDAISLPALKNAVQNKHGIEQIQWDHLVVFVHGVSAEADLPDTVQSLPNAPAHLTLPVACAEF